MAHFHSPRIVTDGLVLALDAANTKSFRGEPTVNVVPNPLGNTGWNPSNFNSTVTRTYLVENGQPFFRLTNVIAASGYPRITGGGFSSIINGTYSTSYEARGTPGAGINLRMYENGSTKTNHVATLTNEWTRYTLNNQSTPFNLNQAYFYPQTSGATYDIRNIQVEAKPYATPFVNGTRGTTVATGGGWVDRSGNNNHGELVNGPTFNSDNLGSLVFDGVNDYVVNGAIPGDFSNFTVCVWFYPISVTNFENPIDCNWNFNANTGNIGPRMEMNSNGRLSWVWSGDTSTNGNSYTAVLNETGLSQNQWHFSTLSRTSSNTIIGFLDGSVRTTTFTISGTPSATFVNTFNNINLGRGFHLGGADRIFTGNISQVQIYNRALSASEVLQNYNATKGRYGL